MKCNNHENEVSVHFVDEDTQFFLLLPLQTVKIYIFTPLCSWLLACDRKIFTTQLTKHIRNVSPNEIVKMMNWERRYEKGESIVSRRVLADEDAENDGHHDRHRAQQHVDERPQYHVLKIGIEPWVIRFTVLVRDH